MFEILHKILIRIFSLSLINEKVVFILNIIK